MSIDKSKHKMNFTAADAAEMLAGLLGNRSVQEFTENSKIFAAKDSVILWRERIGDEYILHLYNVLESSVITDLNDKDKLSEIDLAVTNFKFDKDNMDRIVNTMINNVSKSNDTGTKIYTVIIDESSNDPSAVEYADDAVSMEAGWDNWKGHPLFKDIRPCLITNELHQMSRKVDHYLQKDDRTVTVDGEDVNTLIREATSERKVSNVVIEFPHKLGFKIERKDNRKLHVSIAFGDKLVEGFSYGAFRRDHDLEIYDKLYISAYVRNSTAADTLKAAHNVNPSSDWSYVHTNVSYSTLGNFSDLDDPELINSVPYNWQIHTLLQCLYLLIFKNLDSQASLGKGFGKNAKVSTRSAGHGDKLPFTFGDTSDYGTPVIFLGIEDWYNGPAYWIYDRRLEFHMVNSHNKGVTDNRGGDTRFRIHTVAGDNQYGFLPMTTVDKADINTPTASPYSDIFDNRIPSITDTLYLRKKYPLIVGRMDDTEDSLKYNGAFYVYTSYSSDFKGDSRHERPSEANVSYPQGTRVRVGFRPVYLKKNRR